MYLDLVDKFVVLILFNENKKIVMNWIEYSTLIDDQFELFSNKFKFWIMVENHIDTPWTPDRDHLRIPL